MSTINQAAFLPQKGTSFETGFTGMDFLSMEVFSSVHPGDRKRSATGSESRFLATASDEARMGFMKSNHSLLLTGILILAVYTPPVVAGEYHDDFHPDVDPGYISEACTDRYFTGILDEKVWCGCDQQWACPAIPICDAGFRRQNIAPALVPPIYVCKYSGISKEPDNKSVEVPKQDSRKTLRGWSDIHEHQFANLAYGGSVFWGSPFHDKGINSALPWCDYTHEYTFVNSLGLPQISGWYPELGSPIHGYGLIDQLIWGFTNNMAASSSPFNFHNPAGTGPFDGWPHYFQGGHQQMYYKWLERAYQGGLRLLVNLAVNNKVLCEGSFHRSDLAPASVSDNSCRDMNGPFDDDDTFSSTVDHQIAGMKKLAAYIEGLDNIPGNGWYQIVESAEQARDAIREGKMAVIIGIEVDTLFGCVPGAEGCDVDYLKEQIDKYWDKGVRYIFPVHFYDNAFTGGAWYNGLFVATDLLDGGLFKILPDLPKGWDCYEEGYRHVNSEAADLLGLLPPAADEYDYADCNAKGLTDIGEELLYQLIHKDMIIDIDHLPLVSLHGYTQNGDGSISLPVVPGGGQEKGALEIFEDLDNELGYSYPVHSGHPQVMDKPVSEFQQDTETIKRIRDIGGIASVNMARGRCYTTHEFVNGYPDGTFKDRHVKGYYEVVDLMEELTGEDAPFYGDGFPGISLISDMGAFLDETGPRFWRNAEGEIVDDPYKKDCFDNQTPKLNASRLQYPFEPYDETIATGKFYRQKTGARTFDFNADGLAHIGLMPDQLEDVRQNIKYTGKLCEDPGAGCDVDLDPLFNSAETFIRMWERIENCTPDGAPPVPVIDPLPTVNGVCSATVTAIPTALDNCAVPYGSEVFATTNDPLEYTDQGVHTITWTYEDEQGNTSSQLQTVSVIDDIPPVIDHLSVSPDVLWPPNNKMVSVAVTIDASDNCDAAPFCRITAVGSNEPVSGNSSKRKAVDWEVTGDLELGLRAERKGSGEDRLYDIEVTCSDYVGNATTVHAEVRVPHDQRK